jgi:hypothetical protein
MSGRYTPPKGGGGKRRRNLADVRADTAALAEAGPGAVVFGSGTGTGGSLVPIVVDTAAGRVMLMAAAPPVGASPELLMAFSTRATATVRGECLACGAMRSPEGPEGDNFGATYAHEADCPVGDDQLVPAVVAHREAMARPDGPCPCGKGGTVAACHGPRWASALAEGDGVAGPVEWPAEGGDR